MKLRFAADHNLPEPLLNAIAEWLPLELIQIKNIDRRLIDQLDDWQVLLAIHQLGFPGFVTTDYNMLSLPREMAIVHQTRLTLVAFESVTHNPIQAVGELMVHASHIDKSHLAGQPQIFRIPKRRFGDYGPRPAWEHLERMAKAKGIAPQTLFGRERLTQAELDTPVLP